MVKKVLLGVFLLLIIATIAIVALNPIEKAKEDRDQQRVADLTKLKKALDFYISKNAKSGSPLCNKCALGTDVFSYRKIEVETVVAKGVESQFVNATGWIPVDFSLNAGLGKTPLNLLPIDPLEASYPTRQKLPLINSQFPPEKEAFVYTYTAGLEGKYKLTARMESKKGKDQAANDGGTLTDRLEIGNNLKLKP